MIRRHSSLDMSRSTLWRALHDDLQARCFKPVREPRLTAEPTRFSPLARVGHGAGRAPSLVPARTARHDRGAQCQILTQKPLKRRAPLGSSADAWRACAPKTAISSTACDDQLTCTRFFSDQRVLPSSQIFFAGAKLASALKAPAWTLAQATDCDLESGLRKSISVGRPCPCFLPLFLPLSLSSFPLSLLLSLLLRSRHHLPPPLSSSSPSSSSSFSITSTIIMITDFPSFYHYVSDISLLGTCFLYIFMQCLWIFRPHDHSIWHLTDPKTF